MQRLLNWVAVLLAALLLLGGAFRPGAPAAPTATGPDPGYLAPEIAGQTPDGRTVRLADLRGRAVFINFWASWCGPCRLEMPDLQRLAGAPPSGAAVLTVNATDTEASQAAGPDFMRRAGYDFPVVLDPAGRAQAAYRVAALPTSVVVDGNGVVRRRVAGPMTHAAMTAALAQAAGPAPPPAPAAGGLPGLPEVLAVGSLRLQTGLLFVFLGGAVAWHLGARGLRRRGLPGGAAGDLLTGLAVGALLGGKLVALLQDPGAFLARPALLVAWSWTPAAAAGGAAGAALGLAWELRRLPALPLLDALAVPALAGAAVAAVGNGGWVLAGALAAAATVGGWVARRPAPPGQLALGALALGALALVAGDFALGTPVLWGGLSLLQVGAGAMGLVAVAVTAYRKI